MTEEHYYVVQTTHSKQSKNDQFYVRFAILTQVMLDVIIITKWLFVANIEKITGKQIILNGEVGMKQDRLTQIKHLLMRDKRVDNNDLAKMFGVSIATVRRDLDQLEADGSIRRIYGGAEIVDSIALPKVMEEVPLWQIREDASQKEKCAIAKRVVEKIPDACTVFIDSGTTAYEVAKLLVHRKDLTILTNSLRVATLLGTYPNLQAYCIGGIIKYDMLATAGILASECLAFFPSIDVCVFSADGFIPSWGIREYSMETAMLKKAVADQSKIVIAALDHSKFNIAASAPICRTSQINIIVTDPAAPATDIAYLRNNGVEVVIAPMES